VGYGTGQQSKPEVVNEARNPIITSYIGRSPSGSWILAEISAIEAKTKAFPLMAESG